MEAGATVEAGAGGRSAILIGIDEAGYGPILGPLVVSAVAFEVPAAVMAAVQPPAEAPDLWALLRASITHKHARTNPRLAVADSKQLHRKVDTPHGIALLERAALTFLAQAGTHPASLGALLRCVCPHVVEHLPRYPWYSGQDLALPAECTPQDLRLQANAVGHDLAAQGIRFLGAWVEVLCEGHFNQLVAATHNKATVLFMQNVRLLQRIAQRLGPRPLEIWADRHGGRVSYLRPLMRAFDDAQLEVLEEAPERSGYRLTRPCGQWTIRYLVKGETHHLPIALASIFSKYVRELFMICFNGYWCGKMPGLRPTAGYSQDGQRFLADAANILAAHKVDRQWLVRTL